MEIKPSIKMFTHPNLAPGRPGAKLLRLKNLKFLKNSV